MIGKFVHGSSQTLAALPSRSCVSGILRVR
jgi:hypothetical protein